jgi:sugar (pentulose or hexulose) kinase
VLVYAVDLGTTNIKVVLYGQRLNRLAVAHAPAVHRRRGVEVEFDPIAVFRSVLALIGECASACPDAEQHDAVIAITGQAESVVLVDDAGAPVRPGMSWLDNRAVEQAAEIAASFDPKEAFAITGEPECTATWPAAKLRWLLQNEPESLRRARAVLMIKDDLVRRFTGRLVGEATTRGFTYLYDVRGRRYWSDMLDFCGVEEGLLPEIAQPGSDVGQVREEVLPDLPPARSYRVNVAALDHFCAMVGTGSYVTGVVSESAGTVLSLSMLAEGWHFDPARRVSFHNGLREGETLLFSGADSGGVVLDWYRREALGDLPYQELESALERRGNAAAPIFLPYLTGVNPPDFLSTARGAFVGLELQHDRFDLAFAVEEGVAHLLKRNIEYLGPDEGLRSITSTGGGATSAHWSQLKADVCGLEVVVPDEQEATCRGAAVLALVACGELESLEDAARVNQPPATHYSPVTDEGRADRYRVFEDTLTRLYGA